MVNPGLNRKAAIKAMGLVLLLVGFSLGSAFMFRFAAGGVHARAQFYALTVEGISELENHELFYNDVMSNAVISVLEENYDLSDFCPYEVEITQELGEDILVKGEDLFRVYEGYVLFDLPELITDEKSAELGLEPHQDYLEINGAFPEKNNYTYAGLIIVSDSSFSTRVGRTSDTKPDLVAKSIRFSNDKPKKGDSIAVYVTVENMGCDNVLPKAAGGDYFNVSFYYDDGSVGYILNGTAWPNGLPMGQQVELGIFWPSVPNGTYTVTAKVDSYPQQITELKEGNNEITSDIVITT